MNKPYVTLIGFVLFLTGILSIILTLVGLNLQILGFLYNIGPGFAFLVYILLVMAGGIVMYLSKIKAQ